MGRTLAILLVAATTVGAQVVGELTPDVVRSAITLGTTAKAAPFYEVRVPGLFGSLYKPRLGYFTTPYLRIAQAAYEAKKFYKPFTEADVSTVMTSLELHVYGTAQAVGARVASVQAILIAPKGEHDPAKAIRPTSTAEVPVGFRNLMGMEAKGTSLMAVFPLNVLREGFEVHVIYDSGVPNGSKDKFCEDCVMEFDLKKIK